MRKYTRRIFLIISCLSFLFMASCDDNEVEENTPKQETSITNCRLIGTSSWNQPMVFGKFDSTYRYYDNSGRLSEFGKEVGTSYKYKIVYDQTGRIDKILDWDGQEFEKRFYNASGQLYKVTHIYGRILDSIDRKTFQYDASGKIVSSWLKEFAVTGTTVPEKSFFTKYFYNSKGLLALDSTYSIVNGQHFFRSRTAFKYADDPGIGVMDFYGRFEKSLYLFAPLTHNITSIVDKQTVIGGTAEDSISLKYEYNALGYPSKIDFFYNGQIWWTKKIWNECF